MLYFNGIIEFGRQQLPPEGPAPSRRDTYDKSTSLRLEMFSEVEIYTSWKSIGDTAKVVLGHTAAALQRLTTYLAPGAPVAVHLGYDGYLRREFTGYVARTHVSVPFTVELEDESYWLKRRQIVPKGWKRTTLREVLAYIYPGPLAGQIPDVPLAPFRLEPMNAYQVLEKLKEQFGLVFYFRGKTLFAGLAYEELAGTPPVLYDLYRNVVSNDIEAIADDEQKPGIKAISVQHDGSRLTVEVGDKGAGQVTRHYSKLTSETALRLRAQEDLKKLQKGGLKGTLTTFGIPYITHGQTAHILDEKHKERRGIVYVDGLKTTVSKTGGFRRVLTLGRQAGKVD